MCQTSTLLGVTVRVRLVWSVARREVFATTRRLNVTHKGGLSSFSWVLLTLRFSATAEVCGRAVAEGWLRGVSSFLGSARDREESLRVC